MIQSTAISVAVCHMRYTMLPVQILLALTRPQGSGSEPRCKYLARVVHYMCYQVLSLCEAIELRVAPAVEAMAYVLLEVVLAGSGFARYRSNEHPSQDSVEAEDQALSVEKSLR